MDLNDRQARLIMQLEWVPAEVVTKAKLHCAADQDLCKVLELRGLLSNDQATQVRAESSNPNSKRVRTGVVETSESDRLAPKTFADSFAPLQLGSLQRALNNADSRSLKDLRCGPYVIIEEMSRGGMGLVLRAFDFENKHEIALKVLLTDDVGVETFQRFKLEALALAQLKHPNIVTVRNFGIESGIPYFAMELVTGRTLESVVQESLKKTGRVPEFDWLIQQFDQLATALSYCHSKGLIHRDLKPSNILIEEPGQRLVLIDFGIVKRQPDKLKDCFETLMTELSKTNEILGTPAYMSPEQLDSDDGALEISERTDSWGLGASLYYCLTGYPPFSVENLGKLYIAILTGKTPAPRDLNQEVPAHLDQLCRRCLNRDKDQRPTMADFSAALQTKHHAREYPLKLIVSSLSTIIIVSLLSYFYWREQAHKESLRSAATQMRSWTGATAYSQRVKVASFIERLNRPVPESGLHRVIHGRLIVWSGRWALRVGELAKAQSLLKRSLVFLPETDSLVHTLELGLALKLGQYSPDRLDSELDSLIKIYPRDPELYIWQTQVKISSSEFDLAEEALEKAEQLGWEQPEWGVRILLGRGDHRRAFDLAHGCKERLTKQDWIAIFSPLIHQSFAAKRFAATKSWLQQLRKYSDDAPIFMTISKSSQTKCSQLIIALNKILSGSRREILRYCEWIRDVAMVGRCGRGDFHLVKGDLDSIEFIALFLSGQLKKKDTLALKSLKALSEVSPAETLVAAIYYDSEVIVSGKDWSPEQFKSRRQELLKIAPLSIKAREFEINASSRWLARKGLYKEAIALLEKQFDESNEQPIETREIYKTLASCYQHLGMRRKEIKILNQGVGKGKDLYRERTLFYLRVTEIAKAQKDIKSYLKITGSTREDELKGLFALLEIVGYKKIKRSQNLIFKLIRRYQPLPLKQRMNFAISAMRGRCREPGVQILRRVISGLRKTAVGAQSTRVKTLKRTLAEIANLTGQRVPPDLIKELVNVARTLPQ
jgi:serine/threonine protein kinase